MANVRRTSLVLPPERCRRCHHIGPPEVRRREYWIRSARWRMVRLLCERCGAVLRTRECFG